MKYQGSKNGIAKHLLPIILKDRRPDQPYIEPFVGGGNMIDKVDGVRIGYDVNAPLIACLNSLSKGWVPPEEISKELYNTCRSKFYNNDYTEEEEPLIGYVGINGSYGGRWYDGGYAGIVTTSTGKVRNYPKEAQKNVLKQAKGLAGVDFKVSDYMYLEDIDIPKDSIIYCDPPYKNTKAYYNAVKSGFDSDEFWGWCRERVFSGHKVFVSEYTAPEDFVEVWSKDVKSSLRANNIIKGAKRSTEKLFVHQSQI